MTPEAAWAEVRTLLGARPGGFTDGEELAVTVGERTAYVCVLPFGPDAAVQVMTPLLAGVADRDELCEVLDTGAPRMSVVDTARDPIDEPILIAVLGTVANTAADLAGSLPATFASASA